MKRWERLPLRGRCGGCGELLAAGVPVLVLSGERWRKIRGGCCAGEAPPDLPALESPAQRFTKPMTAMRGITKTLKFNGAIK